MKHAAGNHRNPVPDLLKGIAVLAMIQVHLMELFAREELMASTTGKISLFIGGPFAAPVFMAVMGYFLAASRKSTGRKLWRGFLLILLGLGLNIGLNLHLLIRIFNGTYDLDPLAYIFGADILFLAGFSIIIITLLGSLLQIRFFTGFLLAAGISIVIPFLPDLPVSLKYFQAFFYGSYSWSYFPVFPWLAYPLLGYAFYRLMHGHPVLWNRLLKKMIPLMALSGLIAIILFMPSWRIITDLPAYYHHQVLLFAWLVSFLVIYTRLASWIEETAGQYRALQYVKWLGKNVTTVYVFQWLIIGNIATAIYKTQSLIALSLWFVFILALATVLVYGYRKALRV